MARASALARSNGLASTCGLIDTFDALTPTGVQLLASSPTQLRAALGRLDAFATDGYPHWARCIQGVDLNFGCPSGSVIGHGAGPALLQRPGRIAELFDVLAEWKDNTELLIGAIGAKIRLGLNEDQEKQRIFLRVIELAKGKLDYVTVHARHARDESTVPARWKHIRAAKEAAGSELLVLGNGDVFSRADAAAMRRETGCDGVVVARGAIRSGGLIFEESWRGDHATLVTAATKLEERYLQLVQRFRARERRLLPTARLRPKYGKYHREAFHRIRGLGDHGGDLLQSAGKMSG